MDERLSRALKLAKYREGILEQKKLLKLRHENYLLYSSGSGNFKITPELLTLCKIILDSGRKKNVCIYDMNENPTKILNFEIFYKLILARYIEVVNEHYLELENLKND